MGSGITSRFVALWRINFAKSSYFWACPCFSDSDPGLRRSFRPCWPIVLRVYIGPIYRYEAYSLQKSSFRSRGIIYCLTSAVSNFHSRLKCAMSSDAFFIWDKNLDHIAGHIFSRFLVRWHSNRFGMWDRNAWVHVDFASLLLAVELWTPAAGHIVRSSRMIETLYGWVGTVYLRAHASIFCK